MNHDLDPVRASGTSQTDTASQAVDWRRVCEELRASRELQQQTWGDVDNATLGRYLAGEVDDEERAQIEHALQTFPELGRLTSVVRNVLADLEPLPEPAPEPTTPTQPISPVPALLPFGNPIATSPNGWTRAQAPRRNRQPQGGLMEGRRGESEPTIQQGPKRMVEARIPRLSPRSDGIARATLLVAACLLLGLGLGLNWPDRSPRQESASDKVLASRVKGLPDPLGDKSPAMDRAFHLEAAMASVGGVLPIREGSLDPVELRLRELSGKKVEEKKKAVTWNNMARLYQEQGKWTKAEVYYRQAHSIAQTAWGAKAPETASIRQNLAGIYTNSLTEAVAKPKRLRSSPDPGSHRKEASHLKMRKAARAFWGRLTSQRAGFVQKSVLPVLIESLKESTDPNERIRLAFALAELGPAARRSVPVLRHCLRQARTPSERQALNCALKHVGSVPDLPVETFISSLSSACPVPGKLANALATQVAPNMPNKVEKLQTYLHSLYKQKDLLGIRDPADRFSVHALSRCQCQINELAQNHHLLVLVDVVSDLDSRHAKVNRLPRQKDFRGLHILIPQDGSQVRIHITPALLREGFPLTRVRRCLNTHIRRKQFDKGLFESLRIVRSFETRQNKMTR